MCPWRTIALGALFAGLVAAGLLASGSSARASTIAYQRGWHLVAGPDGTVFRGASALYALDADAESYQPLDPGQPAQAGVGYYAYFDDVFAVRMGADQHDAATVHLPPNRWVLVGNPSAYSPATVSGVDVVYVYDEQEGYVIESSVPPGRGAIVYSRQGGTAVIQPIPGGIDAGISELADKLVDAAVGSADVPAGMRLTRADTGGATNASVPATFIEEFRPQAPPAAAQQTVLISVNLQQAKDGEYAAVLLDGLTPEQVRQLYGASVQNVDAIEPPSAIGDAAKRYRVQLVNGTMQTEISLLAFRRGAILAVVAIVTPADQENEALLLDLAALQDSRIVAAFP